MEQLNRIELRGNVGNCKIQTVGNSKVARFSVATNYIFKGRDGNAVIETTWHNVVAWAGRGMPADLSRIAKGAFVYVSGRMRQQKFTANDGTEKTVYEVVARAVDILEEGEETVTAQ